MGKKYYYTTILVICVKMNKRYNFRKLVYILILTN